MQFLLSFKFFLFFYRLEAWKNKNDRFCRVYLKDIVLLEKTYDVNKFH